MTGRRLTLFLIAAAFATLGLLDSALAQTAKPLVQLETSRVSDTAHLEFKGLKNWRYEVRREGPKKITVSIPPIQEASLARLKTFDDPLLRSVEVDRASADGNYLITFNLAREDVESFDYLTDDPSRLILDFYRRPAAEVKAEAKAQTEISTPSDLPPKDAEPKKKNQTALTRIEKSVKEEPPTKAEEAGYEILPKGRAPAGNEFIEVTDVDQPKTPLSLRSGIFDGGDDNYGRFRIKDYEIREEAVIASRHNIYLPFPVLKMQVSKLDELINDQPEYVVHPKETRENKEARLLLTLFERKRFAVYLKTYDYFTKKYPESEYMEILKNVTAQVYLLRWRESGKSADFDQARALYSELVQKFPTSPLREHNYLILGYMQMERKDALNTIQTFEAFIKTYPSAPDVPQVRKAVAEAYLILRRYDEALAQYETIIKNYPKTDHAREAAFRRGDVAFEKGDYSEAIQVYEATLKELPAHEKVYPNAHFNMAEARFWQKDFKKALGNYIQFVTLFPSHNYGGYALTRVGELLAILGADQRRVMGAYLESYFRFPTHAGAKIARIRMLAQQMRGMKEKEFKKALDEINDYAQTLDLQGIKEFTTLMVSEGLTLRGDYKEAMDRLITYYQKNPTSENLESFKGRIVRNIAMELKTEVEKGSFMNGLKFYKKYEGTWLKNSNRIDIPYTIAEAYERAGAFSEAQAVYQGALAQRLRIVGTDEEKEKKVQEHLPSVDSVHLRLAAVMAQDRDYVNAYQHLKAIGPGHELKPEETVERVQLTALIAEQRNDPIRAREALIELAKKWNGDPVLVAPVHQKLADTYLKLNDGPQAEFHADKILASQSEETPLSDKQVIAALTAKAEAQIQQKKSLAAIETYQKLLEQFESKAPMPHVRFKVGQILFDRGDFKGAHDVWKRLDGTPDTLLWKIGQEKLANAQWQDDYTKYINRIPAMANRAPAGQSKEK